MVINTLKKEIHLFQRALALEKKKRQSILSANGSKLEEITRQSEECLEELEGLDANLRQGSRRMSADGSPLKPITLRGIIDQASSLEPDRAKELKEVETAYRKTVLELKESVKENQTLMRETNGRIQNMLSDLQKDEKNVSAELYGPPKASPLSQKKTPGKILNTDA